jgi:SOS-response transcriptional repressor LexA
MATPGAFSWNSELPSGRNPYWIRDEALSGLGLHSGDAVSVDTRAEPRDGDLVVVEVELDDDSLRTARRYFASAGRVRLEAVGEPLEPIELGPSNNAPPVPARITFALSQQRSCPPLPLPVAASGVQ